MHSYKSLFNLIYKEVRQVLCEHRDFNFVLKMNMVRSEWSFLYPSMHTNGVKSHL